MPAVSDTSPLLGLSAIGCLELLQEQFGAVFIPQAVLDELKIETGFRGTSTIHDALSDGWKYARFKINLLHKLYLLSWIEGNPKLLP